MKIQFWGARGSIPAPLTPQQIQSKIIAAVQRITPKDIENSDSRERFISSLPSWIFGTTGGNTPCTVITDGPTKIILDMGSGLRAYGKSQGCLEGLRKYHIFSSHFHWDHIQGLPFFDPAFMKDSEIHFYSPFPKAKQILQNQMKRPYFPVPFEAFTENFNFHLLKPRKSIELEGFTVNWCTMAHPGNSFAYSFEKDGKKFVYATDVELRTVDFVKDERTMPVFENADCIVVDSQYTVEEACRKVNWGHSAFCYAIDFAVFWNIKHVYLYHHEPTYDDKKLHSILQAARWYAQYINRSDIKIHLAKESREIIL